MLKLLLTCEHGGNKIPEDYKKYFVNGKKDLDSHKGYDIGSLDLFNQLKPLAFEAKHSTTSRLLVELNRSLKNPQLFSTYTKQLPKAIKQTILNDHYYPYRSEVERIINTELLSGNSVLHCAVHSFTPVLNNVKRNCEIGLLYDPSREQEKRLFNKLKIKLKESCKDYRTRSNYPYLGTADGFPPALRKIFTDSQYMGLELEINQRLLSDKKLVKKVGAELFNVLSEFLKEENK